MAQLNLENGIGENRCVSLNCKNPMIIFRVRIGNEAERTYEVGMTQAEAKEIARTLTERHEVLYQSQRWLVVNVSFALAKGMPVSCLCLNRDLNAPLMKTWQTKSIDVSYRKVHLWPKEATQRSASDNTRFGHRLGH